MKTIYIDSDYKCHATDDGTLTAVETSFFDGKCAAFIEGYRFIPSGESWTRSDGVVFSGEMAAPWKDYAILAAYQEQYERMGGGAASEEVIAKAEAYDILTGVSE